MYDERLLEPLEDLSAAGEAIYLNGLVEEARAIVAGTTTATPNAAHLWALLTWVDGHHPAPSITFEDLPF